MADVKITFTKDKKWKRFVRFSLDNKEFGFREEKYRSEKSKTARIPDSPPFIGTFSRPMIRSFYIFRSKI